MLNLTQEEAAALSGLSKRTVISIEQGQRRPISATANALMMAYIGQGILFLPGEPDKAGGVQLERPDPLRKP